MLKLTPILCRFSLILASTAVIYVAADDCPKLEGGYNYDVLTKTAWRAAVTDVNCLANRPGECFWYLQICHTEPVNPCGAEHACEVNTTGLGPVNLGKFSGLLANGPDSFVARFHGVPPENVTKCTDKNVTINLIFSCDKEKHISVGPEAELTKLHYKDINKNGCERNVSIPFDGACTPHAPPGGLSAGSVLLILFFVGLLVYLVGGILIRHNNGARGWEMVPHHQFWSELPSLIVDGCVYFVKLVTCQSDVVSGGIGGGGGGNRSYDNI
ncbi:cation-dependent mannose-6-phosphate receptor-like [Haemaphysalis longicornis]